VEAKWILAVIALLVVLGGVAAVTMTSSQNKTLNATSANLNATPNTITVNNSANTGNTQQTSSENSDSSSDDTNNDDNNNDDDNNDDNNDKQWVTCPTCSGAGGFPVGEHGWEVCSTCNGSGGWWE